MLRTLQASLFVLAAPLLLGACSVFDGPRIVGSGVKVQEVRELDDFDRLAVSGAAEVEVRVGGEPSVELTIDDNLLPYVRTEVVGRTLRLKLEDGARYTFDGTLQATVTVPSLEAIDAAGACTVTAAGIDAAEFEVSVAGSCDALVSGRAESLKVSIAGSADLDLVGLQAARAEVSIAGSGDVTVSASEALDVSIAGSGTVRYAGSPSVSRSVMGSGTVSALAR